MFSGAFGPFSQACNTETMTRTVRSCSENGSPTVKLVTGGKRRMRAKTSFFALVLNREKLLIIPNERGWCLLYCSSARAWKHQLLCG